MSILDDITQYTNKINDGIKSIQNSPFIQSLVKLFNIKIGEDTIDSIAERDRPAVTFKWYCLMPKKLLDTKKTPGATLGELKSNYIESCSINIPTFSTVGADFIYDDGTKFIKSKKPELGSLTMTFYEDEFYTTTEYFTKWDHACYNSQRKVFAPLKSRIGEIQFIVQNILDETMFAAIFYVIPSSQISLNFNGESDRQKIKMNFKVFYYDILTSKELSLNQKNPMDIYNKINSWF